VLGPADYSSTVFAPLVYEIFGSYYAPAYIYVYQIEPLIDDVENWTVNFPWKPPYSSGPSFLDPAFLDLDVVGHDAGTFPGLTGENEVSGAPLQVMAFGPVNKPNNVTYDFDGLLDIGEESDVLWLVSDFPPVYGIGALSDGLPSPGTGLVPVPSPEPGTFMLLMMGIVGLGGVARLRRKA